MHRFPSHTFSSASDSCSQSSVSSRPDLWLLEIDHSGLASPCSTRQGDQTDSGSKGESMLWINSLDNWATSNCACRSLLVHIYFLTAVREIYFPDDVFFLLCVWPLSRQTLSGATDLRHHPDQFPAGLSVKISFFFFTHLRKITFMLSNLCHQSFWNNSLICEREMEKMNQFYE